MGAAPCFSFRVDQWVGDVEGIRGVMGRGVELLRVDVGHRGANHRDEGSRGSAFGMLQPGC